MIKITTKGIEKFGISLYFIKDGSTHTDLYICGIRLIRKVPYKAIQFFKNDKLKKEIPISLLEKLDLQTLMFLDTPVGFKENDKIGIKLVKNGN